ncbi:MAG: hypothetical protein IKA76_03640 [Clostridia bacterium]|nr:hypothetical protein [Clostridia bacterium]
MNYTLSRILLFLPFLLCISSFSGSSPQKAHTDLPKEETECSALLPQTEDRGKDYLDSFIFFGESTTYHMKDREVLRGGKHTTQIWAPDAGTVNLDLSTAALPLRYPETGEYLTLGEAAAKKRPRYLVLTFGLNGAVQKIRLGEEYYKRCYRSLIDSVIASSPHTKILLQSAFPVAENMDMSRYTVSVRELNGYIDRINHWTLELAKEYGIGYLNTTEILKDENGFLKQTYQNGDGHHLTRDAYLEILYYIRTHGCE